MNYLALVRRADRIYTLYPDGTVMVREHVVHRRLGSCLNNGKPSLSLFYRLIGLE